MSRTSPAADAAASAVAYTTAPSQAPDLAELLRSVLLSVRDGTSGTSTAQPLTAEAIEAIGQFRDIDAALRVATVFRPAP